MRPFYISALVLAAVALTIAPAAYMGHMVYRWGEPEELNVAAEKLARFPKSFGKWECVEEGTLTDDAQELLKYRSYISRSYRNREDGRVQHIIILVGRPGPIVRHPPEFCYNVRGNVKVGEPTLLSVPVGETDHNFRLTEFKRPDAVEERFLVCTAWGTGERFETSDNPRVKFGGEPYIYALQVLSSIQSKQDRNSASASIKDFLSSSIAAFSKLDQISAPPTTTPRTPSVK